MPKAPNLNSLPYFEAVARRGSVTRAAEELSVSPSGVSQQIKHLEQQLGVKLFRRSGRSLALTLEGELLAQTAGTALKMLSDVQANLGGERGSRRLNLRVSPSFGVRWLGPRLSDFVDQYPDWALRVDAAPDPTDFDREIMDLEVRYGAGSWPGLHCQPLVDDYVLPLACPEYAATLEPESPLSGARLIDSARALCQWDFWLWHNGVSTTSNTKSVLMDRSSMALQLACDGAGVVLESLALAQTELADGRLVPVTPSKPILRFSAYWLLCPARFLKRRPVRLFMDWVGTQADAHQNDVLRLVTDYGMTIEEVSVESQLLRRPDQ